MATDTCNSYPNTCGHVQPQYQGKTLNVWCYITDRPRIPESAVWQQDRLVRGHTGENSTHVDEALRHRGKNILYFPYTHVSNDNFQYLKNTF